MYVDTLPSVTESWRRRLVQAYEAPRDQSRSHITAVGGCLHKAYYDRVKFRRNPFDEAAQAKMEDGKNQETMIMDYLISNSHNETESFKGPLKVFKVDSGADKESPTAMMSDVLDLMGRADAILQDQNGELIIFESKLIYDDLMDRIEQAIRKLGPGDLLWDWFYKDFPKHIHWAKNYLFQIIGYQALANLYYKGTQGQEITKSIIVFKSRDGRYRQLIADNKRNPFIADLWDEMQSRARLLKHAVATKDISNLKQTTNLDACNHCPYTDRCDFEKMLNIEHVTNDPTVIEDLTLKLAGDVNAHDRLKKWIRNQCLNPGPNEEARVKIKIGDTGYAVSIRKTYEMPQEIAVPKMINFIHDIDADTLHQGVLVEKYRALTQEEHDSGTAIIKPGGVKVGNMQVINLHKEKKDGFSR